MSAALAPDEPSERARELGVASLIQRSFRESWSFHELPWNAAVDAEHPDIGLHSLLDLEFAPMRRMSAPQRHALAFAETCYHLSNLLAGERSGERLGAQVLLLGRRDEELLAILVAEEAKHYLALERYLREKAGRRYEPNRTLSHVIDALEASGSPAVKLLVGQVILEWTAAALLATLVTRVREPLLRAVLRLNLRDESRHIAYGYLLRPVLARAFARSRTRREMEDLAYEAVRASAQALIAGPVWREFGLPVAASRRYAAERLAATGVLERYRQLVPQQLARCGFPTERLSRRLERDLGAAVMSRA